MSYSNDNADSFNALVLAGKDADPNHTWSTVTHTPITISVNLQKGQDYIVYICLTDPALDSEVKFLGKSTISSGGTKTIYVAKPNDVTQLYAVCFNDEGFGVSQPINGYEIAFSSEEYNVYRKEMPYYNSVYYAFEYPGIKTSRDYDFNDLVLQVSAIHEIDDTTYTCYLSIAAVGTELNTFLLYNGEQIGDEIHARMDIDEKKTVNTSGKVTQEPRYLGELTFKTPNVDITSLPFSLHTTIPNGSGEEYITPESYKPAPLYIVVSGDTYGKWRWVREGGNIGLAFPDFGLWGTNQQTATDWYQSTNAISNYIMQAW